MPKPRGEMCREHFVVGPWQTKKQASVTNSGGELYSEVVVQLGTTAAAEEPQAPNSSGKRQKLDAVTDDAGAEQPAQQAAKRDAGGAGAAFFQGDYDSDLDHCDGDAAAAPQCVLSISGGADIAVVKDSNAGLVGNVRDSRGALLASFTSEVLLRRQECTRDDDFSLHLLRIVISRTAGGGSGSGGRLQVLAECTGEDAIRLRAPPAAHGAEEEVARTLSRRGPLADARLSFDCESLWEADSVQAHAIAAGLGLAEGCIAAVNTGPLVLEPAAT